MGEPAARADPRGEPVGVESVVPVASSEYYQGVYWNNYEEVIRYINRRVSGDGEVDPWEWFHNRIGRAFRKALVINCGNGWVERQLVERGIIESAVGVDVMPDLVEEARRAAAGLPLHYEVADTNRAEFPEDDFDLVINHAALHHVAYLDRAVRRCCELLPAGGVLVNYDYVGPHRNQYSYGVWEKVHQVNRSLPESFRQHLTYPHLQTMLVTDPTEAVHSELTLNVTRRYFDIAAYRSMGGAIAYPLLTHNAAMTAADATERSPWIARILEEDERWDGGDLFAFYFGPPRKATLEDADALARWRGDEDTRERLASTAGGTYYDPTLLQELTQRLSDAELASDHMRADLHAATAENERLRRLSAAQAERLRSRSAVQAASLVLRRMSPRVHQVARSLLRRKRPDRPPA
jgi:SAM-dependent methyltransferase